MTNPPTLLKKVIGHAQETAKLSSTLDLLAWDERTKMPAEAGAYRAEQLTLLSGMLHARRTASELGEWLGELSESPLATEEPHGDDGATIREMKRAYDKQSKLPQSLVEELTRQSVLGQQTWVVARKNDDFTSFQPILERIVELKKQQAETVGYEESPYDALLDDFEPGEKASRVAAVLTALREQLTPLVAEIAESKRQAPIEILRRQYPVAAQELVGRQAAKKIGFSFKSGRLDITDHPFCTTVGPRDCRITTRYDEKFFSGAFFGTLHESGHGMYEQGLREEQYGLPPGEAASLGIHESQSRMWENLVGRSQAFWNFFYPHVSQAFPSALKDVSIDDFYFAVNDVGPSLIRVQADEATYNLHITIRFELEQALLTGDLTVAELPGAWRERYERYLGISAPSDADGVLQDVHWSAALFGYFPTYSLGNLYASQLFDAAREELGDLDAAFAAGDFSGLRHWLRTHVHRKGRCMSASELVLSITGKPLGHEPLMRHLRSKLGPLYDLG